MNAPSMDPRAAIMAQLAPIMAPLLQKLMSGEIDFDKLFQMSNEVIPRMKHNHALLVEIAKKLGIPHQD